ncbi:hypothetical protein O6H91_07G099000 [Diphasiastrum complanatum]|uniref:Uncharacterized protein n=2 Tax=Diphasiastrum complanatum TaxID=34168 RepID=A0ACC2D879_DIPCM|nr:hypothetical protein O6H91_07G098200 [Diphasiastrum complanatum]KAJ7550406.1 hypothetical protein O6H91_07G099000 [Diphasiastrum complanatum]
MAVQSLQVVARKQTDSAKVKLELEVASAKGLKRMNLFRKMKTYVVVGLDSGVKISSPTDRTGGHNPKWNAKFEFEVEESLLYQETSALTIEIYCNGWCGDRLVGTVRVLLSHFLNKDTPTSKDAATSKNRMYMSFQVRRPSGDPKGALMIGVTQVPYKRKTKASVGRWYITSDGRISKISN